MGLSSIFDISASGLVAESLRLTTTASNMSNANVASQTAEGAYRGKYPILSPKPFSAHLNKVDEGLLSETQGPGGVQVDGVYQSMLPAIKRYEPNNPLANEEGYVFMPNINMVEEMTNMISASRSYRMNVQVVNTTKELISQTLQLGK